MIIARLKPLTTDFFTAVLFMTTLTLIPAGASFAQYANPSYRPEGSRPQKGQPVNHDQNSNYNPYATPSAANNASGAKNSTFLEVELSFRYATAMGDAGQSFKPGLGAYGAVYLAPFFDEAIANYISVAYESFTTKGSSITSLKVIPFLFGIEFGQKNTNSDFTPTFAFALGGAYAFAFVPNAQILGNGGRAYFALQARPGLEFQIAEGWNLTAHTPITFLVGSGKMSYFSGDLGVRFEL